MGGLSVDERILSKCIFEMEATELDQGRIQ
jgi:hypothetical protein